MNLFIIFMGIGLTIWGMYLLYVNISHREPTWLAGVVIAFVILFFGILSIWLGVALNTNEKNIDVWETKYNIEITNVAIWSVDYQRDGLQCYADIEDDLLIREACEKPVNNVEEIPSD